MTQHQRDSDPLPELPPSVRFSSYVWDYGFIVTMGPRSDKESSYNASRVMTESISSGNSFGSDSVASDSGSWATIHPSNPSDSISDGGSVANDSGSWVTTEASISNNSNGGNGDGDGGVSPRNPRAPRSIPCPFCARLFRSLDGLSDHQRALNHIKVTDEETRTAPDGPRAGSNNVGDAKSRCLRCNRKFPRKTTSDSISSPSIPIGPSCVLTALVALLHPMTWSSILPHLILRAPIWF